MPKPQHWPTSIDAPGARAQLVAALVRDMRSGVKPRYGSAAVVHAAPRRGVCTARRVPPRFEICQPADQERGLSRTKAGGALLLLDLVLTSLSYAGVLATAGSGRYYVATGTILFGAFALVRGLIEVSTARE